MTRNWELVFQSGQDFSPLVISYLLEIEAILASGGAGGVATVSAADGSIVIGGTVTNPTVKTGTLDAIATAQPPAAAVALNGQKITGLAAGVNPTDAANVSQIGGGGGSGTVTSVSSANTSIAVATGTTTPVLTVATLDVLAANGPPAAAVALNAKKITGLANGSLSSDAAAFGQIPAALPPNGAAGGVLSGTYPNPGMAAGAAATNLGSAGGDLTGTYPSPTLAAAGPGATGPLGSATVAPIITIDAKGRVTALTSATIVPTNAAGGDLAGNYPNPTLKNTGGGAAGPIGDGTHVAAVTVDAAGRVTALSSVAITASGAVDDTNNIVAVEVYA